MLTLDQLSLKREDPQLVVSEAKENRGLDLLGLRAPAEAIANRLLNGVTTVTPAIRYLSLRSWLILRYLNPFSANRCSSSTILGSPALQPLQLDSRNRKKRV